MNEINKNQEVEEKLSLIFDSKKKRLQKKALNVVDSTDLPGESSNLKENIDIDSTRSPDQDEFLINYKHDEGGAKNFEDDSKNSDISTHVQHRVDKSTDFNTDEDDGEKLSLNNNTETRQPQKITTNNMESTELPGKSTNLEETMDIDLTNKDDSTHVHGIADTSTDLSTDKTCCSNNGTMQQRKNSTKLSDTLSADNEENDKTTSISGDIRATIQKKPDLENDTVSEKYK